MNLTFKSALSLFMLISLSGIACSQGMKMGEVIIVSASKLKKDVKHEDFTVFINEKIAPLWKNDKKKVTVQLFKADRGNRKGELLLVFGAPTVADRKALTHGSPFSDNVLTTGKAKSKRSSDFLSNTNVYTEYRLIGADKLQTLPSAGILGIHNIKVKKERAAEFEKLVTDKLHPAVAQLFPDMQLLYYKAVAGEHAGTYITIFTIESTEARDKYWPAGKPETAILKQTFKPLEGLAKELGTYLVEDSYLKPESGGAAAYWESREWTDFIHQRSVQ